MGTGRVNGLRRQSINSSKEPKGRKVRSMNENQRLGIMGIGVAMLVVVIGLFL